MDLETHRLLNAIEQYIENPPHEAPNGLITYLTDAKEMLGAARYSEESPGMRTAREVAEETMPKDVYKQQHDDFDDKSGLVKDSTNFLA